MEYRCDVSNWSTAHTSLWLNRHTSKLIFCWEVLFRLPSAQIFVLLVDYRKWRLPFLLFELESDSLTYTYFGGCFILVCLSLGKTSHAQSASHCEQKTNLFWEVVVSIRHTHVKHRREFNFSDFVNGVITKDSFGMRTETILAVLAIAIGKLFFTCWKLIPWVIRENVLYKCYFSNSFAWKTSLAT